MTWIRIHFFFWVDLQDPYFYQNEMDSEHCFKIIKDLPLVVDKFHRQK